MINKYANFLKKKIIVGITYFGHSGKIIERRQFYGIIKIMNDNTTVINLDKNGKDFSIPTDLDSIEKAKPGIYKLKSTGEAIEDPDFITVWTVTKPKLPVKKRKKGKKR